MNQWFRSWHGAPTDSKWILIARRACTTPGTVAAVAWALLDYASQQEDRGSVAGFDWETYAAWSGFDEQAVAGAIAAMKEKGIIDEGERLAAWEARQPERDGGSAERMQRLRERRAEREKEAKREINTTTTTEKADTYIEREGKSSHVTCDASLSQCDASLASHLNAAQPQTPPPTRTIAQPRRLDTGNELFSERSGKDAYEVYREVFRYIPSHYQITAMNKAISDLDKWREVCRQWNLKGYRSNNIADLLRVYAQGWESGTASFVPRVQRSKVDQSMDAVDRVFARMEAETEVRQ